MTALMRAAQHGHLKVVKVLVENDAILDIKFKVRFFSAQLVLYKNALYSKVVMLLACIFICTYPSFLQKRKTAIMYAIQGGGHKEVVKELRTAGANVSIKDKVRHHIL